MESASIATSGPSASECPDEEKVRRSVPGRPVGAERVVDAVEDHGDLALIDAVILHEVLLRLL
jgi:hypothetical protein